MMPLEGKLFKLFGNGYRVHLPFLQPSAAAQKGPEPLIVPLCLQVV